MFTKILIANRGEIAIRVIKACRELGIKSVAVYSTVDRNALHVQEADEAVWIGEAPAQESYLNIEAIIGAIKKTGANAVHPGYGFLAENHLFAERCEKEGIVFIGPDSRSMKLVSDKVASRQVTEKVGIPLIPGMKNKSTDVGECMAAAEQIGFPVLLKASAGGGGKGMRIIKSRDELASAVEAGMREAKSAFGDPSVYLEKYIEQPRHVEFQVLADKYGNAIHVFERECSIQRRHQKIVEESPSPALNEDLRRRMGETALKVVEVSGYSNAGTVEFLVDKKGHFYFLEVNARLQVEHPVTELVTGIDLVHAQFRIAAGEKLWIKQDDLKQRGHAIECRIYAEDPENGFLPSAGNILFMKEPTGPGIRHDCGIYSGYEVPVYYDPILSKLIAWAPTREHAIKRMAAALLDFPLLGIKTNIEFLREIMTHPEFANGNTFTDFIPRNLPDWTPARSEELLSQAALAAAIASDKPKRGAFAGKAELLSPWETLGDWHIGSGKG
ncbi:MAG TPA: acetyl-CoA carboxylase biotin carboxylase subunit [candidate division Zixibacteria bacterium]|nr:acetyl-CoA carboxylase biotin carboxylase subunit [candidate division Zixibacteria bacterium]HBZ02081.1 acetyl-CoA carboxylase biotin carboxylase subunit [candidate division Zixibacteria bacterium]